MGEAIPLLHGTTGLLDELLAGGLVLAALTFLSVMLGLDRLVRIPFRRKRPIRSRPHEQ